MSTGPIWDLGRSFSRHLALSFAAALLLVGGFGGWAATTELMGAVVASGTIVVDSFVKKVQHPSGGVVGQLLVRDGESVRAGQVVLRLDETVTRANLAQVDKSLIDLNARRGRLEAERDGADEIAFAPDLLQRGKSDADVIRLFQLRREARSGQKAQMNERIKQLQQEIAGLTDQKASKEKETQFINRELQGCANCGARTSSRFKGSRLSNGMRPACRVSMVS